MSLSFMTMGGCRIQRLILGMRARPSLVTARLDLATLPVLLLALRRVTDLWTLKRLQSVTFPGLPVIRG
jgi:hypothetical protein